MLARWRLRAALPWSEPAGNVEERGGVVAGDGEGRIVRVSDLTRVPSRSTQSDRQGGDVEMRRPGWAKVSFLTSKPMTG